MLDGFALEPLAEPLLRWFSGHARVLPWREKPTPYRVWISEIMLQQTRVEAVKPYFERFTRALPDVRALADCPEDRLLKLWEGLGYYNRARNLQAAARQMTEQYHGRLPDSYEQLLGLKGIGHYTAGAVASIAYGQYVPAVDGNVLRVLTRVAADDTDIMNQAFRTGVEKALGELLQTLAGRDGLAEYCGGNVPGAFNQALMELGATVCVPNGAPLCEDCPWQAFCLAKRQGIVRQLPVKRKAKERRVEERTVLILRDGERVAIRKRPRSGLLAGLYELPNVEGHLSADELLAYVKQMRLSPVRIQRLADARHVFSHVEWRMWGYAILVEDPKMQGSDWRQEKDGWFFVDAADAGERYAIPAAFAAYAQYIDLKLGNEKYEAGSV